jgi:anti-sigma B factor antagonist
VSERPRAPDIVATSTVGGAGTVAVQRRKGSGVENPTATVVQRGGEAIVVLEGELDLYAEEVVRSAFDGLDDASGARSVTVDLTRATFIDSTILGELLRLRRHLAARGCSLVIVCGSLGVRRAFEITGLDGVFTVRGAEDLSAA